MVEFSIHSFKSYLLPFHEFYVREPVFKSLLLNYQFKLIPKKISAQPKNISKRNRKAKTMRNSRSALEFYACALFQAPALLFYSLDFEIDKNFFWGASIASPFYIWFLFFFTRHLNNSTIFAIFFFCHLFQFWSFVLFFNFLHFLILSNFVRFLQFWFITTMSSIF